MNREQIIKALECCISGNSVSACMGGCPLYEKEDCECINDDTALLKYALSLIKELTIELDAMRGAANSYKMQYEKVAEENERLRAENARCDAENHAQFDKWLKLEEATKRHHAELFKEAKIVIKEDTVRKMQERLYPLYKVLCVDEGDWRHEIDQIAKEILEECYESKC